MRDTEQGQARLLGSEHNEGEDEMHTVSQVMKTRVDGAGPVDQQDARKRNDAKEVVSVFSEAISYAIITQLKSLEDKNLQ